MIGGKGHQAPTTPVGRGAQRPKLVFIDADKPGYAAYWDRLVP